MGVWRQMGFCFVDNCQFAITFWNTHVVKLSLKQSIGNMVFLQDEVADKNVRNAPVKRPDGVRPDEQLPHTTQISKKKNDILTMNEFVQTDMNKGVADSAPEAPVRSVLVVKYWSI